MYSSPAPMMMFDPAVPQKCPKSAYSYENRGAIAQSNLPQFVEHSSIS